MLGGTKLQIVFLLLATYVYHQGAIHGQQLSPGDRKKIDDFVKEAMRCQGYTGLLVSVVRGGEAVFTEGYGLAIDDDEDASKNVPVTADTLFPIASVSKHFTSSIIGHVLQNTSYDWDTPYRQMMKELFDEEMYFSENWRTEKTTIKDLLAHRLGISSHDVLLAVDQWTKPELIERIRFLRPNGEFRNSHLYNNIMYTAASYVAERHAGKEWDELLRDNFFNKLGMHNTSTIRLGLDSNYSGWARPHVSFTLGGIDLGRIGPLPMWLFRGVANAAAAAGGIATTAKDMAKWMNFQLNFDKEPYSKMLDPTITRQIRRGVWADGLPNPENTKPRNDFTYGRVTYGMGIGNEFWRGHPLLEHGGSIVLYTSHYALLPLMNMGVFISSNEPAPGLPEIRMFIMDVLLGIEDPYMNITKFCDPDFEMSNYDEGSNEDFGLRYGIEKMLKTQNQQKLQKIRSNLANKDLSKLKSNKNAYSLAKTIKALPKKETKQRKNKNRVDDFEKYTGTFGNFAYGNCTIELYPDDDDLFGGDLMLTYGWVELTLKRVNNTHPNIFELTVVEIFEPTPDKVTFWSSKNDGVIDRMELSLDPEDGTYPWIRNLKSSDAPPPPTGKVCPTPEPPQPQPCPTVGSGSNMVTAGVEFSVLTLLVILNTFGY